MKVLFAISNEEISGAIVKKYQKVYKEIISYKNVYYFNAILKEIQKDKTYDRIVISEELESFANNQYEQIDKIIFDKLDSISDEASNSRGADIPIILICSDRRTKSEQMLVKLFGIGIYNAIIGNDRSVDEVCRLINKPRSKKEAKQYYKIDSDDVTYKSENENDVSEIEIQNIIAHYKKLGKNEDQYIKSFNNIADQYNDTQLKIICKFLPLNVRAVLEEKSPKYQKVMAFTPSAAKQIQINEEKKQGVSKKLLNIDNKLNNFSNPVVVPSAVDFNNVKKLTRTKKQEKQEVPEIEPQVNNIEDSKYNFPQYNPVRTVDKIEQNNIFDKSKNNLLYEQVAQNEIIEEQPVSQEPKRGRGRPRKNPVPETVESVTPKKRGRPRKNPPVQAEKHVELEPLEDILPGFQNNNYIPPKSELIGEKEVLPGFEEDDYSNTQSIEEEPIMPGFDNNNYDTENIKQQEPVMSGFNNDSNYENNNSSVLPGFDDDNNSVSYENNNTGYENNNVGYENNNASYENNNVDYGKQYYNNPNNDFTINSNIDISKLLTPGKKVVTFVGTSKNGTSFIVNNLAAYTSSNGIKTAILDTTKNRNAYYIYTRNDETLRKNAANSINNLINGIANGIEENPNLTVYTSLPNDHVDIQNSGSILKTLVENYSLVIIDCDFDTPEDYFRQSQETYLVQSLDILTIQPLTAFLRDLEAKNAISQDKIRIILNKCVNIRGVNEKIIIGGMSCYNDPSMSFNTDLFDRDTVKFLTIPFEEEIYTKYLEEIINCNISIRGYSKSFMQVLKSLQNMVYPYSKNISNQTTYQPSKPTYNKRYN